MDIREENVERLCALEETVRNIKRLVERDPEVAAAVLPALSPIETHEERWQNYLKEFWSPREEGEVEQVCAV